MSRNSRSRDMDFNRHDDRRSSRFSEDIHSRVWIGNVNTKSYNHREVIDWMSRYGRVLDVGFFERHILVQFDREHEAKKAVDREKGQTYRGMRYDIRIATSSDGNMNNRNDIRSRSPREPRDSSPYRDRSPINRGSRERFSKERNIISPDRRLDRPVRPVVPVEDVRPAAGFRPEIQETNFNSPPFTNEITAERPGFDAAIIVSSSELLRYAETIEAKLQRQIALTTHIIVLKEESHANACVEDLTNKGVLYAFIVHVINEKHSSCTLRVLYGTPQEHRNMPLVSALNFVADNFQNYQKRVRELKTIAPKPTYDPSRMPPGFIPPDDKTIYYIHLLADSRMLTIEELEKVIEFVQQRIQALTDAEQMFDKQNVPKNQQPNNMPLQHQNMANAQQPAARSDNLIALQKQLHTNLHSILQPGQSGSNNMDSMNRAPPSAGGYPNNIPSQPQSNADVYYMDQSMKNMTPLHKANAAGMNNSNPSNVQISPNVQKAIDNLMSSSQFRTNLPASAANHQQQMPAPSNNLDYGNPPPQSGRMPPQNQPQMAGVGPRASMNYQNYQLPPPQQLGQYGGSSAASIAYSGQGSTSSLPNQSLGQPIYRGPRPSYPPSQGINPQQSSYHRPPYAGGQGQY